MIHWVSKGIKGYTQTNTIGPGSSEVPAPTTTIAMLTKVEQSIDVLETKKKRNRWYILRRRSIIVKGEGSKESCEDRRKLAC